MTTTLALDIARQLAAVGIPIFVAYPGSSASTGYCLPSKWQRTIPNPAVVDSWRPGMALCAVMGHGLDLVDIDPRHGGDPAALDGKLSISYGRAATPSGGVHIFVKSLGVRSCDNVVKGIDIKAGNSMGVGYGFAFIAPTERVTKVDGAKRAYEWITPPDLDRLKAEGSQDDSGKALIWLINAKRNGHRPASSGIPIPGETVPGDHPFTKAEFAHGSDTQTEPSSELWRIARTLKHNPPTVPRSGKHQKWGRSPGVPEREDPGCTLARLPSRPNGCA
jgi:hypothetical protein